MNPVPFYEMFPFLKQQKRLAAAYQQARVVSVVVNNKKTQMDISISLTQSVPPVEIAILEGLIAEEYSLQTVNINVLMKAAASDDQYMDIEKRRISVNGNAQAAGAKGAAQKSGSKSGAAGGAATKVIMGRVVKTAPKAIVDVSLDDGKATVRGYVCDVRSRLIEKSNSTLPLLDFDITDYTSSINVSGFLFDEKQQAAMSAIEKGMYLTVSGNLNINKYDQELTLSPQNIFECEDVSAVRADEAETKRVELHLHTKMSAGDALTDVGALIKRAIKWGHPAVAITDHGVVHSFPEAAGAAAKAGGKVKIIYGIEGYFCNAEVTDDTEGDLQVGGKSLGKLRRYHIILLAKNKKGINNLYKLVSLSHIKHFYKKPLIFKNVLEQHREGLIVGGACEAGEVFSAVKERKSFDEICEVAKFYDYLEIMPLCNNMFMTRVPVGKEATATPMANGVEELRAFNEKVVEVGRALGIPVVATGDAHFLDPDDEIYRQIIFAGKKYQDSEEELPLYFRTTDEMLEEFSYLGEELAFEIVVANTNKIADMCEDVSPLPPKGELFPPKIEGSAAELERIIVSRVPALYGNAPPYLITERVNKELEAILKLGYDVIYMAAQKLVSYLVSEGARVGSRGSVGSSFIAYLAGITEVNPLPAHYRCANCKKVEFPKDDSTYACGANMPEKECPNCGAQYLREGFNIPFETFLGLNGEKVPDIDLNISSEYSDKARLFVFDMFGEDYVYRAGTIGTIASNTAYGYVRTYFENIGKSAPKAEMNRLALGCDGVKQTTSQHPGGYIIIPQGMEVTDFCPVQYPADDKTKNKIITHFDYHKMEDNLVKLDMLGHDDPTMLVALERMTGVNADDIKLDDPDTISIFSSPVRLGLPEDDDIIGKTGAIGIPEFGTLTARKMLVDTQPDNFDMLVRLSGYAHGENVWYGNARELIISGKATVTQTISSRDDIMIYLISKGMEAAEAFAVSESIRKGKGIPKGKEGVMRSLGVPGWYLDSCKKITYLFPRAHAVAYVMMAFRIAWFKVHRPLEYYSTYFYRRSQKGRFDVYTMTRGIDVAKAEYYRLKKLREISDKEKTLMVTLESCYEFYMRGFDFAPIDLYESDAERFIITDEKHLRPPFVAISGLGDNAARSLAENREGRRFISMEEITAACPSVNKTNLAELARIGALGDIPETSQMSLF